jgi:hypothetical protein
MAIFIRPASLDEDRGFLIEALSQCLSPQSDGRRYDWLYRECPHGEARVWIAREGNAGPILGAAAVFPRRMYVAGVVKTGCVLGDFFIFPQYRTLGPALLLQRTCLAAVESKALEPCYDFPAAAMVPVYKRLAIEPREQLVRLGKPLRADRRIREWVKAPLVARGLSAVSNRMLDLRGRGRNSHSDCAISVHAGPCGEEFSTLARAVSARYGVCVERSAEYLNWRYGTHPSRQYEILTARRDGRLLAYTVLTQTQEDGSIVDLFGVEEPAVVGDLVVNAVEAFRRCGLMTASVSLLDSDPRMKLFQELDFHARESCPVILYPQAGAGLTERWLLMDGDRES